MEVEESQKKRERNPRVLQLPAIYVLDGSPKKKEN